MVIKQVEGGRLKRVMVYYMIAGLVCLIVWASVILCGRYRDSFAVTVNTLQQARQNLLQVRDASHAVDSALSGIKAVLPPRMLSNRPEEVLLEGLDDLKERMKGADITVPNIERKSDEVSLQVHIKLGTRDYTDLVNTIGYLQSLQFPFFSITNISLGKGPDKVLCDIQGSLRVPKK